MPQSKEIVCLSTTLKIYRIYFAFPSKDKVLKPGPFFYIKFTLLALIGSVTLIGSTLHLIMTLGDSHRSHVGIDVNYVVSFLAAFALIGSFIFKVTRAAEMYMFLSDFEVFGKPIKFDERNKFLDNLSKIHYVYLESLIVLIILISNIFRTKTCEQNNIKYDIDEICGLFSYIWLPFDVERRPIKQIFLAVQVFGIHYIYMLSGLLAWLVFETIQHILVRLRHVRHLFVEAIEESDSVIRRRKFGFAVRYHNAVLSLEDKLNEAFSIFMFTHMVLTSVVLGTGVFALFQERSLSSFLVCMGWFWGLMMVSFSGQFLQDESLEVGFAIYQTNWHKCEEQLQKDIMIAIHRSRIPMQLKALVFGVMDKRMYLTVLKATYSYITLLFQRK